MERVLQEKLHSPAARGFSFVIGAKGLQDALKSYQDRPKYQRLVIEFERGEDPDDAYSEVPYEKGANFLLYLGEISNEVSPLFGSLIDGMVRTPSRRIRRLPSVCQGLCQHVHGKEYKYGHLEGTSVRLLEKTWRRIES